ncbi:MAG TPA: low molecular weight protein-tyrosine-phosphatase [Saprospiraceae bacterium]|jgi:protein-tyrosine phosphatase|nr:low molecular weight phosphotyrosine protein phosphatase [Saprospiraceae bacterium]HRO07670.1 low molecular weight protein-tyrosine-phosphatase [Saprospiraceae bacterium]HRO72854.1 low molecular weight protein-tyrosine-phosphatase [Saprospiraceae bacterium]HRP40952.1 low molecular weight protein-tyrosine-phosphatase [Saprospiraceae bacterium]
MKILMVCLGNICRSPLAHGILERKIAENALLGWKVDSAGTSGWHNGEAPDNRAIQVALKNGFDISGQISRKITVQDFNDYDLILTMDTSNYNDVLRLCTNDTQRNKVRLIMNYLYPDKNISVPDPYYNDRFDEVVTMLDQAINELIASVLEHHHV